MSQIELDSGCTLNQREVSPSELEAVYGDIAYQMLAYMSKPEEAQRLSNGSRMGALNEAATYLHSQASNRYSEINKGVITVKLVGIARIVSKSLPHSAQSEFEFSQEIQIPLFYYCEIRKDQNNILRRLCTAAATAVFSDAFSQKVLEQMTVHSYNVLVIF